MSSSKNRSSGEASDADASSPLPRDGVQAETALVAAFLAPRCERLDAIEGALRTFRWVTHRELACLGLAENREDRGGTDAAGAGGDSSRGCSARFR